MEISPWSPCSVPLNVHRGILLAAKKVRQTVLGNAAYLLTMVVLKSLCLKFGSYSMSHLLWVGSIDMSYNAIIEACRALRWGTRIGSEDLFASILSYSWIKCTCLPLHSQLLAEEK